MAGRKRKPTALHEVEGTTNVTRHRDRQHEPRVEAPLGDAPADWKPKGKVLWHEIANSVPRGVATGADRIVFELLVRLVAEVRADSSALTPALASQIRACAACFGMTPSDRSRLSVPLAPRLEEDSAAEFFTDR
jgi:hypothetical protein